MIKKHGSAKWSGGLKDGKGHVSTETGVLSDQPYGFNTRFEGGKGTNPEELLGAEAGDATLAGHSAVVAAKHRVQLTANSGENSVTALLFK